jgi:hypothetical protein
MTLSDEILQLIEGYNNSPCNQCDHDQNAQIFTDIITIINEECCGERQCLPLMPCCSYIGIVTGTKSGGGVFPALPVYPVNVYDFDGNFIISSTALDWTTCAINIGDIVAVDSDQNCLLRLTPQICDLIQGCCPSHSIVSSSLSSILSSSVGSIPSSGPIGSGSSSGPVSNRGLLFQFKTPGEGHEGGPAGFGCAGGFCTTISVSNTVLCVGESFTITMDIIGSGSQGIDPSISVTNIMGPSSDCAVNCLWTVTGWTPDPYKSAILGPANKVSVSWEPVGAGTYTATIEFTSGAVLGGGTCTPPVVCLKMEGFGARDSSYLWNYNNNVLCP